MRMLHIVCDLTCSTIFFHIIWETSRFSKKKPLLKTKCVSWFSLQLLPERNLILRITEPDMIRNVYCSSCKYPAILVRFYWDLNISTGFQKIIRCQISWKSIQWAPSCSMRTQGQNMTKLIFALRSFAKEPKIYRSVTWLIGLDANLSPLRLL